jgi:SAM-dependent methyltransferase
MTSSDEKFQPSDVLAIYDEAYANQYPSLYLRPWTAKHQLNVCNIERILGRLGPDSTPHWLDLACGQAWHFASVSQYAHKVGLDLSQAQLAKAQRANPHGSFVCADMSCRVFESDSFDLITSFWAAYCYLNGRDRIESFIRGAIDMTKVGGAIYFEVLLPEDLETFNLSVYAERTGFRVRPRSPDYTYWSYRDAGGEHVMMSPRLALFLEPLSASFAHVEAQHDSRFMVHVVATGKRAT